MLDSLQPLHDFSHRSKKLLKPSHFRTGVVASRPQQMYAWPGLCKAGDNHLIAIATERKYHVCPFGRLVIMRSNDGNAKGPLCSEPPMGNRCGVDSQVVPPSVERIHQSPSISLIIFSERRSIRACHSGRDQRGFANS